MSKHKNKNQSKPPAQPKTVRHVASLRAPTTYSDRAITVDAETGVIRNVNLMEVGPARGHGFDIDLTTIQQLVALIATNPDGVKTRFKHPEERPDGTMDDSLGTLVGCVKSARVDGSCARGDIYLGNYAKTLPGLGDVWTYLLSVAAERPTDIGMSAVIEFDIEYKTDGSGNVVSMPARISGVQAVDIVGQGAATPNGLLSTRAAAFDPRPPSGTPNAAGWSDPNPKDMAKAPIPTGTPEFPNDTRGSYLAAIVKDGPLSLAGLAARFSGRLEAMRAGADWLVSNGYAEKVGFAYKATPKGVTKMAAHGVWK